MTKQSGAIGAGILFILGLISLYAGAVESIGKIDYFYVFAIIFIIGGFASIYFNPHWNSQG